MLGLRQTSISNDKITLIGMMGTGKSKFGRLVAKNLNFNFYDVDTLVENKFKTSIKNLFMKFGEPFFRNIEAKTIRFPLSNNIKDISNFFFNSKVFFRFDLISTLS